MLALEPLVVDDGGATRLAISVSDVDNAGGEPRFPGRGHQGWPDRVHPAPRHGADELLRGAVAVGRTALRARGRRRGGGLRPGGQRRRGHRTCIRHGDGTARGGGAQARCRRQLLPRRRPPSPSPPPPCGVDRAVAGGPCACAGRGRTRGARTCSARSSACAGLRARCGPGCSRPGAVGLPGGRLRRTCAVVRADTGPGGRGRHPHPGRHRHQPLGRIGRDGNAAGANAGPNASATSGQDATGVGRRAEPRSPRGCWRDRRLGSSQRG
jgi:hypothetical protein